MRLDDILDPDTVDAKEVELDGVKLKVASTLSTRYNDYLSLAGRRAARGAVDLDTAEGTGQVNREGAACLVLSWNLEDELTVTAAAELFRRKPKLLSMVQAAANEAAIELGKSQNVSATTPENSTKTPSE